MTQFTLSILVVLKRASTDSVIFAFFAGFFVLGVDKIKP